jgi:hypothetical protein
MNSNGSVNRWKARVIQMIVICVLSTNAYLITAF